jgi:SAM-dependent methyltransferase
MGEGASRLPLVLAVFVRLLRAVGLPFLALSTTSLVVQRWLSVSTLPAAKNPYVLYAASNLGSLLGLLAYPLLVEPLLPLSWQGRVWWAGYAAMAGLHALCMPRRGQEIAAEAAEDAGGAIGIGAAARWLMLSAAPCAAFVSVSNVLTLDVASVPLLWVLPLGVYLTGFILTFKRTPWIPAAMRRATPWAVMLGIFLYLMSRFHLALPEWLFVGLHMGVLFVLCADCCGRLSRSKPEDPRHLTSFYLWVAVGGLAGSAVVSWVFPLVTSSLIEYPAALFLVAAATAAAGRPSWGDPAVRRSRAVWGTAGWCALAGASLTLGAWGPAQWRDWVAGGEALRFALAALLVGAAMLGTMRRPAVFAAVMLAVTVSVQWTESLAGGGGTVRRTRNYYGIYRVFDRNNVRFLQHGSTLHGQQHLTGPKREMPISYYHPTTPVGELLSDPEWDCRRIGMIGLGSGTLAAYGRADSRFRIYELDPDNVPIAQECFTYLGLAQRRGGTVSFILGDGRLSLKREPDGALDVLVVDAFNSGSIPVHLLTVEAFREYARAVRPDGLVLLHVSNRVLDLEPVVFSGARQAGLLAAEKDNAGHCDPDADVTCWMALTRDAGVMARLHRSGWWTDKRGPAHLPRAWTDDYSNLLGAMFRRR